MKIFRLLLLASCAFFPLFLSAQHVDGSYMMQVIAEIASDTYQGRETGTPGCVKAELFVAREFRKLGLTPAGDSGTFFHRYIIPEAESSVKATLTVDDRTFYQGYNEDFSLMYKSSWGKADGEIVFAGYGIYDPEKNRNDFDSLDIKNKIVLIKRGAPRNDIAGWMPSCIDSVKAEYCYKNGALGVLFFEPLVRTNQRVLRQSFGNHLAMVSVLPDFPVFSVDERVVRYIFTNAGQSYYRVISLIEMQPASFYTGRTCVMTAKGKSTDPIKARNVLGMIQGTDRHLKNEYIIIGGHIDHIGSDDQGKVWNGADDNASGVAAVLGVAKAMKDNNFRPARSIVFAAWSGEEMGLLGSKAWCEKPTIDLTQTLVYFNLDMVGVGNGKLNMPGIGFAPEVTEFIKKKIDTVLLNRIIWSEGGPGGSDHNNFLNLGVPAFAGMTAGSHPNYHQPGDDPEKINPDILQHTGEFIYQCTRELSESDEVVVSSQRFEKNRLKLFSFAFFNPVDSKEYMTILKDRNFKVGIVNFSSGASSPDANENFVSLIYALDSALNKNNTGNRLVMTTTSYDAMMTRSGLLAAFNPDAVDCNELKFKVLSRLGYRFAVIDNKSALCQDTILLQKVVKLAQQQGVGLILDGLDSVKLGCILSFSADPCLIINTQNSGLSVAVLSIIREKGHIVVYRPQVSTGMEADFAAFSGLNDLIGIDNVLLSPGGFDEEGLQYLQKFVRQIDIRTIDKDAQYKLLGDNFYNIAVRSLQAD